MKKIQLYLRRYPFSVCCVVLIWYLCIWFMPPELPELRNVAFLDKWTHFVMYGGTCTIIWWEYLRSHRQVKRARLVLMAWLAPIVMSGVIELVQEYCTENRAGEWLDLAANATGCTLGAVIGLLLLIRPGRPSTGGKDSAAAGNCRNGGRPSPRGL